LYLDGDMQERIRAAYRENIPPSVLLENFLEPRAYAALATAVRTARVKPAVIPDRYSRREAPLPPLARSLVTSASLRSLIKRVTGTDPGVRARIHSYAHRDFTLRQDDEKPPGLLLYFDLTEDWVAGSGGETVLSNADGELARITPHSNTLVIVNCARAWPFLRYCNHRAGTRVIVRIVWTVR
jgi:hypothetical protein